ncbi:MAG: hypothetical protein Q9192_001845 [Flavoplaca navasiana]
MDDALRQAQDLSIRVLLSMASYVATAAKEITSAEEKEGDLTARALRMTLFTTMPSCQTRSQASAMPNSAPLPSPPTNQPSQYFLQQAQSRNPLAPTSQPQPSSSQQKHGPAQGVQDSSMANEDFCLIAEAAKRAQVAVVMRDLGEVTL